MDVKISNCTRFFLHCRISSSVSPVKHQKKHYITKMIRVTNGLNPLLAVSGSKTELTLHFRGQFSCTNTHRAVSILATDNFKPWTVTVFLLSCNLVGKAQRRNSYPSSRYRQGYSAGCNAGELNGSTHSTFLNYNGVVCSPGCGGYSHYNQGYPGITH